MAGWGLKELEDGIACAMGSLFLCLGALIECPKYAHLILDISAAATSCALFSLPACFWSYYMVDKDNVRYPFLPGVKQGDHTLHLSKMHCDLKHNLSMIRLRWQRVWLAGPRVPLNMPRASFTQEKKEKKRVKKREYTEDL
jgi:hypothetical protein